MNKREAYLIRFPQRRQLTNKLSWIKRKYGEEAVNYFLDHPLCEECGEEKLCTLAIHHTEGKNINKFKTLCSNCHLTEHSGSWKLRDCLGMIVRGKEINFPRHSVLASEHSL